MNTRVLSGRAEAYERFCEQLRGARLRPGQFVSQRELVEMLHMPLGAVRELIPRLEAAGLLRTVPKRGLQIAPVDLKLIRNAFQVRSMVEREAIVHFSQVVTPAELDTIEAEHLRMLARAQSAGAPRLPGGLAPARCPRCRGRADAHIGSSRQRVVDASFRRTGALPALS